MSTHYHLRGLKNGRKGLDMKVFDIIKYEGPNNVFVWKFPGEDFNTLSQLIVHESQEAVFFKNGQALDVFGPGRYTLHSANIPLIRRLVNLPFNGESPFHCEVYFINKVVSMDVMWGTPTPIPIQDGVYKIIIPIRSHGQFAVRVEDSRKLLKTLVGTIKVFDQDTLTAYFRGILLTNIKDYITGQFVKQQISFLEIQAHLKKISSAIAAELQDEFEKYGIELVNFNVVEITPDERDSSYQRLKQALAKKAEMSVMGYNYQQERTFNVLDRAAANEGSGSSLMNAGLGLGMGAGIGGFMMNTMGTASKNVDPMEVQSSEKKSIKCESCGAIIPAGAKFCLECGTKVETIEENRIKCPSCGKIVQKGKFCMECGYRFVRVCPECGAELATEAKFCFECGTRLS